MRRPSARTAHRRIAVGLVAAMSAGLTPCTSLAAPSEDEALKAAVIYNFSRFAKWDAARFAAADSPVVLCVAPSEPLAEALDKLEGRPVGARRLQVRRTDGFTRACHLAFVSQSDASRPQLSNLAEQGVLTVGDARDFSRYGAIGLIRVGRQIRFEINNRTARAAGVELSSQLLRLAVVVR